MTSLNIIGDSGKRKSNYDPTLADRINAETEARLKKEKLEEKLKKKAKPSSKGKKEEEIILPQAPDFKEAFFLEGDFGKQINEKIQAKYADIKAINKVVYDENDKLVKGSTPFYVVAVNEIFKEEFPQFRTATQADLEKILKNNTLGLKGLYEDSALVLRNKDNPNKYLAKDLFKQFKDKGKLLKENSAYVFPLNTLKLRKDDNSGYKLSFDITDLTLENYFEAPILNETSQKKFNSKDIEENTGLPSKVRDLGDRTLYTSQNGLCRLDLLLRNLSLDSGFDDLASSGGLGRVVVFSGEAASRNFYDILAKNKKNKLARKLFLAKRYLDYVNEETEE